MSEYRIQGNTGEWEVVIGLEVHAMGYVDKAFGVICHSG
jgi:hypothetical protein